MSRGASDSEAGRLGLHRAAAIALLALCAHAPAIAATSIWDDRPLVFDNPLVTGPRGLVEMWSPAAARGYFAPITTLSFWVERRLWGDQLVLHHLVEVALHALAAILAARLAGRLGVSRMGAFLTGLLFASHPVTVESVAWISERKNLLSTIGALLATTAFVRYEASGRLRTYAAAFFWAYAALLAKSAVVALPLVWLVLAWWRRGRVTGIDVARVAPVVAASIAVGLVTLGIDHPAHDERLFARVAGAGCALWFYLGKLVLPLQLAMVYPRWRIEGASPLWLIPLAGFAAMIVVTWRMRDHWGRGPVAALVIFTVAIAPALGVVPMAYADHSRVADHLQYAPMLAILTIAAAGLAPHLQEGSVAVAGESRLPWIGACGVVPLLVALASRQATVHASPEALWTQTIEANPSHGPAYLQRAIAREDAGDFDGAVADLDAAIARDARMTAAYVQRGNVYLGAGRNELALADFDRALAIDPRDAAAWTNRGNARRVPGPGDPAIEDFTRAIELAPELAGGYVNRAIARGAAGDAEGALRDFDRAVELEPGLTVARYDRGLHLEQMGRPTDAVADFDHVLTASPDDLDVRGARLRVLLALGRLDEAREDAAWLDRARQPIDPASLRALGR